MRKVLNTLVMYGEAFGAKRMVKITGQMGHSVIGTGSMTWKPVFDLMEELIDGGALPRQSFTTDPRGVEPHVPMSLADRAMFKVIFSGQKRMEKEWERMGIKDSNAYTCTAYMDEVGNIPEYGDILGWAESSAVSYANSVIGARCNRNSGILELMSNILGYVPEFGLLTDEGRKADWIIEVKCQNMPEPQLLGSAIGFKCVEDVPFIRGLDKWLGSDLTQKVRDYLKDMGAAAASNGSVGLYHVENITPEAVLSATPDGGNSLIKENAKVFVIDDEEIARVKASYPNPWEERKDSSGAPELAFAGCPHFSCEQLCDWTDRLTAGLEKHGNTKVTVNTIFCAAPDVRAAFEEKYPQKANKLKEIGVTVSGLCPLSYTSNPLTDKIRIITASNKLRYYSKARFFSEEELIDIITGGWNEEWR
jgi:predicted aconitase